MQVGEVIAEVRWTFSNGKKKKTECESPRQREREERCIPACSVCLGGKDWLTFWQVCGVFSPGPAPDKTRAGSESVQCARPRVDRSVGVDGDTEHPMIYQTQRPDSFTVYTESERRVETRMMKSSFSVSLITMFWFYCATLFTVSVDGKLQSKHYFDCNYWNVIQSKR